MSNDTDLGKLATESDAAVLARRENLSKQIPPELGEFWVVGVRLAWTRNSIHTLAIEPINLGDDYCFSLSINSIAYFYKSYEDARADFEAIISDRAPVVLKGWNGETDEDINE